MAIARDANPVVEVRPVQGSGRPVTRADPVTQTDIEWFDAHRVGKIAPPLDAGTELSQMRDGRGPGRTAGTGVNRYSAACRYRRA